MLELLIVSQRGRRHGRMDDLPVLPACLEFLNLSSNVDLTSLHADRYLPKGNAGAGD